MCGAVEAKARRSFARGWASTPRRPTPTPDLALRYRVTHGFTRADKARNLLDPSVRITQGGEDLLRYERGISVSLGVAYEPIREVRPT